VSVGRLVTVVGGQPEIFPVDFVTQRRTVLCRTAQGPMLYSAGMARPHLSRGGPFNVC
jgi:hypothetical protein